jgi:hypothetical protein
VGKKATGRRKKGGEEATNELQTVVPLNPKPKPYSSYNFCPLHLRFVFFNNSMKINKFCIKNVRDATCKCVNFDRRTCENDCFCGKCLFTGSPIKIDTLYSIPTGSAINLYEKYLATLIYLMPTVFFSCRSYAMLIMN